MSNFEQSRNGAEGCPQKMVLRKRLPYTISCGYSTFVTTMNTIIHTMRLNVKALSSNPLSFILYFDHTSQSSIVCRRSLCFKHLMGTGP